MKAHESQKRSRKPVYQGNSKRIDTSSPVAVQTKMESASADYSKPLYRPGSLSNNVSRTLREGSKIYPKLTINEPGDKHEQEADHIARKVVQQIQKSPQSGQTETHSELGPEKPVKPRESTVGGMEASPAMETAINQELGKGQSLPPNIRQAMESAFGADFSAVRVHTDSKAHQLNQSIQAQAFTTGHDIFFRQGSFQPNSTSAQELLAHELTHVVQQTS